MFLLCYTIVCFLMFLLTQMEILTFRQKFTIRSSSSPSLFLI